MKVLHLEWSMINYGGERGGAGGGGRVDGMGWGGVKLTEIIFLFFI